LQILPMQEMQAAASVPLAPVDAAFGKTAFAFFAGTEYKNDSNKK
jgi:hypothetical protein